MQISISGQNLVLGSDLQDYVKGRITASINKYFSHATSANIHFTKQARQVICDIIVHDGTGRNMLIKSNAYSDDAHAAFDTSLVKAEKQLRKYKSKLKDRHDRIKVSAAMEGTKYVISPYEEVEDENNADYESNDDYPVIIAEKPTEILPLSVGEAVMKMDLENLPALMFKNVKNDRINVVYYKRDGNIAWVDSR